MSEKKDANDELAVEYREKIKQLHLETPPILQKLRGSLREFIEMYSETLHLVEGQKKYLDLKDEFRNWISKFKNISNIHTHKITHMKAKFVSIIKKDELDSYRDKEVIIEYRIRDMRLYKDTIDLYLETMRALYKDLDNISYHLKVK